MIEMTWYRIGVDPGLSGAVAVLDDTGDLALLSDLPTLAAGKGAKISRRLDPAGLARLLEPYRGKVTLALVEQVAARPGQGVASVFSLGDSFGTIRAVLACLAVPVRLVPPAEWKRAYRLDSDKERARAKAIELFPSADLHRKADHNRAEALLMARFALSVSRPQH